MTIMLAGIPVQDGLILKLARMVDDDQLADRLEHAQRAGVKILALELADRETILAALDDPPPGLEELRGVLLRDLTWLRSEGIV